MSDFKLYWLDTDQVCGINCAIRIEISEDYFRLTDLQDCFVELTTNEWEELKIHIKTHNDLTNDFEDSVCFTNYEKAEFICAVVNNELN